MTTLIIKYMSKREEKPNFIISFYEKHKTIILEMLRFVIIGGINTLLGGILIPFVFEMLLGEQSFTLFNFFVFDMPMNYGFLVWFTFAYYLQIKFVFKCDWNWKRYFIYPLTQIPNLIINQVLLWLFKDVCKITVWNNLIARGLAAVIALPIMFLLIRLVVKPLTKKSKKNEEIQKDSTDNQ